MRRRRMRKKDLTYTRKRLVIYFRRAICVVSNVQWSYGHLYLKKNCNSVDCILCKVWWPRGLLQTGSTISKVTFGEKVHLDIASRPTVRLAILVQTVLCYSTNSVSGGGDDDDRLQIIIFIRFIVQNIIQINAKVTQWICNKFINFRVIQGELGWKKNRIRHESHLNIVSWTIFKTTNSGAWHYPASITSLNFV